MASRRTACAAALLALVLGGAGLSVCFRQDSPGRPDDVAELLPADAVLFAELVRAPRVFKDWKDYVGAFCTPPGREAVCGRIEKAVTEQLDRIPERLLKDLEKGLPTLQRVAVAILGPREAEELGWIVVATTSDAEFLKRLAEDLKVFAFEERAHQGRAVMAIRKLGDLRLDAPVWAAAADRRLIVASHWEALRDALDRAAGKGRGPDLRAAPLYSRLGAPPGEDPHFRGFAALPWNDFIPGPAAGGRARHDQWEMDEVDALLDFRRIRGATTEAVLRPGRIASRTRVDLDAPCRLYDAWKQPAGPRDLLRYVPADGVAAAHVSLKGGPGLWKDLDGFLTRAGPILAQPGRPSPREEFRREMESEFGFGPEELAGVIGDEALLAVAGPDAFASERNLERSWLVGVKVTDPVKAAGLVEKWKRGRFEKKEDGDAALYVGREVSLALHGRICLIGPAEPPLRAALKAAREGQDLAKRLPARAAGVTKVAAMQHRGLWQLLGMMFRNDLPDVARDLDLDAWAVATIRDEKDAVVVESEDAGCGWAAQAALLVIPPAILSEFRRVRFPTARTPEAPPPAEPEPPALPAAELAERVRASLQNLRSEDIEARTAAKARLKALGRQAIPAIAEAAKKERDLEARESLVSLLQEWKAYEAFPEALRKRVDGFIRHFEQFVGGSGGMGYAHWQIGPQFQEGRWGMEPTVYSHILARVRDQDVLEAPGALRILAEEVGKGNLPLATQRNLAAILAFRECGPAGEAVLEARAKAKDPDTQAYLQIALGWSGSPKALEALLQGVKDPNVWIRRASFLGIERTRDAAVIPKLMDLLADPDRETRWNASYTLRALTRGQASVNVFLPEEEVRAQRARAAEWWRKNGAAFRIAK